ncbi:MAG: competence/damage-inducible protein A [Acidimicrobiia bacterium]
MIVEVIAVGTELLLGQIVNSNTSTMGAALAEHGLDAHYQQTVGDNLGRIASAIRVALDRSDAVVITGGIGPTQDDITREAVCAVTGREMVFSEEYADHLREWWARRGREMPQSNLRQAYHPAGAELIPNPRGTAPGLVVEEEGKLIFCVPGVPAEMEHLMSTEVLPRLVAASDDEQVIASRLIRTWGRPESEVAEILDDLYTGSVNPSLAFLASNSEIKIRITAKASTSPEARRLIDPMENEVRSRLGDSVFGSDDETIERVLFRLLSEREYTIGTAESMTGGMVTARLTDLPGSSAVVKGGLVAYDSELKQKLLGVADVSKVVTVETAVAVALGARTLLGVDVAVSVTGSAGPEPLEKPVGTVIIGVATPDDARARELRFTGDRERVRTYGTAAALQLTRLALIGKWWKG